MEGRRSVGAGCVLSVVLFYGRWWNDRSHNDLHVLVLLHVFLHEMQEKLDMWNRAWSWSCGCWSTAKSCGDWIEKWGYQQLWCGMMIRPRRAVRIQGQCLNPIISTEWQLQTAAAVWNSTNMDIFKLWHWCVPERATYCQTTFIWFLNWGNWCMQFGKPYN